MRLILLLIAAAGALWWWQNRSAPTDDTPPSPWGFVAVPMPDGAPPDEVIILTPQNCPSELAQRADALFRELRSEGIPVRRSSNYSVNIINPGDADRAALARFDDLARREGPIVPVRGYGKANPRAFEVESEYRRHENTH